MKLKVIQNILIIVVFLALVGTTGWGVFDTVNKIKELDLDFKSMDFESFKPDKFDFQFDFLNTGFKGFSFKQGFSGPGGCTSETECLEYCQNPDNYSVCQDFNDKIQDQIADIYKDQFSGPGGCTSIEECEEYCQDLSHQQECFEYGISLSEI